MSYVLVAGLAVASLLIGAAIGYWFAKAGRANDKAKISEIEDEFGNYKDEVTRHFAQTADHFQNLGKQYRELYDHMAAGSAALCNSADAAPRLPFGAADAAIAAPAAAAAEPSVEPATEKLADEKPSRDEPIEAESANQGPREDSSGDEAIEADAEPTAPVDYPLDGEEALAVETASQEADKHAQDAAPADQSAPDAENVDASAGESAELPKDPEPDPQQRTIH